MFLDYTVDHKHSTVGSKTFCFTICKINLRDNHRVDHTKVRSESSFFAFLIELWKYLVEIGSLSIRISLFKTYSWKVNLRHGCFIAEWLVCYHPPPSMGRASLHLRPYIQIYHIPPILVSFALLEVSSYQKSRMRREYIMVLGVLVLLMHTGLLSRNRQAVC